MACGNLVTRSASELDTVRVTDGRPDWSRLDEIVDEWQPDRLVIGIPGDPAGRAAGAWPARIRRLGRRAAQRYNLPVEFVDEQLTSATAQQRLKDTLEPGKRFTTRRRQRRDRLAAVIILESYFEQEHQSAEA